MLLKALYILIFAGLILQSCNSHEEATEDNPLLAEVLNEQLLYSDIKGQIPVGIESKDSIALVGALTEQWIQTTLLTKSSKEKFKADNAINKLTQDYKDALIIHKYEEHLIDTQLDSVISAAELNKYYQQEKNNFRLDQDLYNIRYAIIPETAAGIDRFFESWKVNDIAKIESYCSKRAVGYCVGPDCWYTPDQIVNIEADNPFKKSDIKPKKGVQKNNKKKEYFLKIVEVATKGDLAPLKYVESDLKKVLLYRRKKDLLKNHTQELYNDLLAENKIKNYLKLGK